MTSSCFYSAPPKHITEKSVMFNAQNCKTKKTGRKYCIYVGSNDSLWKKANLEYSFSGANKFGMWNESHKNIYLCKCIKTYEQLNNSDVFHLILFVTGQKSGFILSDEFSNSLNQLQKAVRGCSDLRSLIPSPSLVVKKKTLPHLTLYSENNSFMASFV